GLSIGTGFNLWTWSQPATDWSKWDILLADLDGDNRADLYLHATAAGNPDLAGLSTGAGFTQWSWSSGADWSALPSPVLGDYNGDRESDLLIIQPTGASVAMATGATPDLLTSVSHPLGSTTTVTYAPSSAFANTYMPFVVPVVSSYAVSDGRGTT